MRKKLTIRTVKALKPGDKTYWAFDTEITGYGIRVLPTGTKSFGLRYVFNGKTRWKSLGKLGDLTADEARKLAEAARGDLAKGVDPLPDEPDTDHEGKTVDACWRAFVTSLKDGDTKPRTIVEYERLYRSRIGPALAENKKPGKNKKPVPRLMSSLTRADAIALQSSLKDKPSRANHALATLSSFYNFCIKEGRVPGPKNLCTGIKRRKERPRERVLSLDEITRLEDVFDQGIIPAHAAAAFRLMLYLGCRRSEVLGMLWKEVDLEAGTIRLQDAKAGPRTVYMTPQAKAVLAGLQRVSKFVIPGDHPDKPYTNVADPWRKVLQKAGIEDARMHDLRRSFATHALNNGTPLVTVSKLLGHADIRQTVRAYAFVSDEAQKQAVKIVGDVFGKARTNRHYNVTPIRKAAS